jgi:hypothetical protein
MMCAPLPDRIVDALDRIRGGAAAGDAAEKLERHEADAPGDAADAESVVADRADDSGDVRAVTGVVRRRTGAVDRVDAVHIVDVAVAVVVAAVAGDLERVAPEVRDEIGVVEPDPGVDHRDDDLRRVGAHFPAGGRLEVGAGNAVVGAVVEQRPLPVVARIVGRGQGAPQAVHLHILIPAGGAKPLEGAFHRFAGGQFQHPQAAEAIPAAADPHALALFVRVVRRPTVGARLHDHDLTAVTLRDLNVGGRLPMGRGRARGVRGPARAGQRGEGEAEQRWFQSGGTWSGGDVRQG